LSVMGAGIQFAGIQDVVVPAVIDMMTLETVMTSHMQAVRKSNGLAPPFAVLLFYGAGIQHGERKDAGEYKQHQYGTENGFFG